MHYHVLSCLKLFWILKFWVEIICDSYMPQKIWGKEVYMENIAKATLIFLRASVWKVSCFAHVRPPIGILLRSCSLPEVVFFGFFFFLFLISVKSCIFLPFSEGGLFGVWVICNTSSNLIMNLWNLFSQLQYYSWLKLGMPVFNEMPTLNFLLNENENKH